MMILPPLQAVIRLSEPTFWGDEPTLLIFTLIFLSFLSFSERKFEKEKATWQTFATTNHLDFRPTTPVRKGISVSGIYYGYQLELFTQPIDQPTNSKTMVTRLELAVPLSVTHPVILNPHKTGEWVVVVNGQTMSLVEAVNQLAPIMSSEDLSGEIGLSACDEIYYQQQGVIGDIEFLQALSDRLRQVLDYYGAIVELGGEAVPFLEAMMDQADTHLPTLACLLQGIGEKTAGQLSWRAAQLLCPRCLVSFGPHRARLNDTRSITYYGCCLCKQSRAFLPYPSQIVAVLKTPWSEPYSQQKGVLRINWLTRRILFNFDRVEIIRATDEEVERFAVQVGNDTDTYRKPRYRDMTCTIGPECRLSENTLRILERMFGRVEREIG